MLLLVMGSTCKSSLEQCVSPPVAPAACPSDRSACGVVATPDGEVNCGDCPGNLECGQLEPNVCGGIVCERYDKTRQVIRELRLVWSPDAGVYLSPSYFGLHFEAAHEDSTPKVVGDVFDNRGGASGTVSLEGDVVTVTVKVGAYGSGGIGLIAACSGSAISSASAPAP